MEISRSISVACAYVLNPRCYVDALAASGIMGIRAAKEARVKDVLLNDRSREAYELIKMNCRMNGVECRVENKDANILLREGRYDLVDLDPFGSPVTFLDSAAYSSTSHAFITATDTAPLCGAHPSGRRKYDAIPVKTEYHQEVGVRILLGKICRTFAKYEKRIVPMLSISRQHFIRVFLSVRRGAREADEGLKDLGFIAHCSSCLNRFVTQHPYFLPERCEVCGSKLRIMGPMFISPIHDGEFCRKVLHASRELGLGRDVYRIVSMCSEELQVPFFYDHHALCKKLKVRICKIDELIEKLRKSGFLASRTHFSGTSFKTNAPFKELIKFLT